MRFRLILSTFLVLPLTLTICHLPANISNSFPNILSLLPIQFFSNNIQEKFVPDTSKFREKYDFIIVGAGSGGCVVANRLTENKNWNVLLIEAGGDESFFTDIPLLQAGLGVTQYNWGYRAQRQKKACLLLKGGVCNWPMGKGVGGTTIINDLLYSRGNKYDYDMWKTLGNDGWGYEDVFPYFLKSENGKFAPDILIDKNFHGYNGYLNIEHIPYRSKLVQAFVESAKEVNLTYSDINGKNSLGFSPSQSTMKSGIKHGASKAFLRPIRNRKNLHLTKNSFVTKLLIDVEIKKVEGVYFVKNGKTFRIEASKEVILTAGTTKSPQILMLSGIGPKDHLNARNITVVQDLPVGFNLQDHVSFPGLVFLVNDSVTLTGPKILSFTSMFDYITGGKGPYTVPGGAEGYAFLNTGHHKVTDKNYADLEIILAGAALNSDTAGIVRNLLRIGNDFYNDVYKGIQDKEGFAFVPILQKPYSRGRIMLKNNNPFDAPVIHPNSFDDERDLDLLIKGTQLVCIKLYYNIILVLIYFCVNI